jgi:protease-4
MAMTNGGNSPFSIFGKAFYALVSFIILLFLFSLFFIGAGFGLGSVLGKQGEISIAEKSDYTYVWGNRESENRLLLIPIEGIILGSPSFDFSSALDWMGVTYGYEIQEMLKKAAEKEDVKGIFLHLQTPGGTIYGSMAIHEGIKAYQKTTGKPVLAYIEGLSASGGVMAMSGANAIYADYGSAVGSIGVIGGALDYFNQPTATEGGLFGGGIVTKGGIERTIITAGRGKDLGNPFRKATPEEIQNLQKGVNNAYDGFVNHMAENRKIDPAVIREKMGAQIFDNQTAQEMGLIDGTLNRNASMAKLAEMAGLGNDFQIVHPRRERNRFWEDFLLTLGRENFYQARVKAAKRDICMAIVRVPLVYYGDWEGICRDCAESGHFF